MHACELQSLKGGENALDLQDPDDVELYRKALQPYGATPRQAEVAMHVTWHRTNSQIAEALGISVAGSQASYGADAATSCSARPT